MSTAASSNALTDSLTPAIEALQAEVFAFFEHSKDVNSIPVFLTSLPLLQHLFELGRLVGFPVQRHFEEEGLLEILEQLQYQDSHQEHVLASGILSTFFDGGDEESEFQGEEGDIVVEGVMNGADAGDEANMLRLARLQLQNMHDEIERAMQSDRDFSIVWQLEQHARLREAVGAVVTVLNPPSVKNANKV